MLGQSNKKIKSAQYQRILRRKSTDAECLLWRILRDRQLAHLKFRRQHPYGKYNLDFACLEEQLVIELDGSQHLEQRAYDEMRTKDLEMAGFRVIRFWDHEVLKHPDSVKERIWMEIGQTPTPILTPTLSLKEREP